MCAEVSVTATVAGYVASFLFDKGGSSIVESMKKKLDRQKFKKRERVLFEYHFRDVEDEHELKIILDFIDGKVVLDNLWYSHEDKISIEQQDSLRLEFQNFKKRESGDSYAPLGYKEKLSKCANFHNKLVNEIVLSEKDHLVINALLNKQREMAEAMTEAMKVVTKEATKEVMIEIMEEATKEAVKKTTSANRRTALSNKDSIKTFQMGLSKMRESLKKVIKNNGVLLIFLSFAIGMAFLGIWYNSGLHPGNDKVSAIIKKFTVDDYALPYHVAERYLTWFNMRTFFFVLVVHQDRK